jgi:asparagine synthase (glutamine-hydrolysing)
MTAIAGLWRFDGRPDAADGCRRMLAAQKIYGPHLGGQWANGSVALGRQLMRVLPEDAFDRQPLAAANGRFVLVADVRLDNRSELSEILRIPDTTGRAMCDAAFLLAAFDRWHDGCVERLVGDFAFALWDGRERRLWLARDALGQRPLYYHRGNGFFAFASMPKGLHALPEIPYEADEERIAEFLVLMPEAGPRSFFRGIERVELGQIASVTASGIAPRQYWNPQRRTIVLASAAEYAEAMRHHLDQAVLCRLRGTGNIGTHLSAGLDSSAVTTTAARLLDAGERRIIAFTAVPREGYTGPAPRNRFNDESPYAAETAAMYPNIEHVIVRPTGRSPLDELDRFFALCDRPALNLCNLNWANGIADAARERGLGVLLCADMGNMTLSYNGNELLAELIRRGRVRQWWREVKALVARPMRWRGVLAQTFGPWIPPRAWNLLNRLNGSPTFEVTGYSAINPARIAEINLPVRARARGLDLAYRPRKDGFSTRLWVLRRADSGSFLKGMLGGWQIDQRDPLADIRLVEFCLAVPTEQFLHNGMPRALARRVLADRVPRRVLDEPARGYQAADWHERITGRRAEIAAEVARLDNCVAAARALDLSRMRHLLDCWPTDGWVRDDVIDPYRLALLRGLSGGRFLQQVAGSNR